MKNQNRKLFELLALGIADGRAVDKSSDIDESILEKFKEAALSDASLASQFASEGLSKYNSNVIPLHWLIYLSTLEDKTYFYLSFKNIIRNPGDIHMFLLALKESEVREGAGRVIKSTINRWLLANLNEYWVCQYKSKLSSIIRTTHLKAQLQKVTLGPNSNLSQYLKYIREGEGDFPRIQTLNDIMQDLNLDNVTDITLRNISNAKVQWDEIRNSLSHIEEDAKRQLYGQCLMNTTGIKTLQDFSYMERMLKEDEEVPEDILEHAITQVKSIDKDLFIPLIFLAHSIAQPKLREKIKAHIGSRVECDVYVDMHEVGEITGEIMDILELMTGVGESQLNKHGKLLIITKASANRYLEMKWDKGEDVIIWQLEPEAENLRKNTSVKAIYGTNLRAQHLLSGIIKGGKS